jgi:hypothetical protein
MSINAPIGKTGEEKLLTASRDAWWIVTLALQLRETQRPKVGEWAVEITHAPGLRARRSMALDCAIGKIVSIEGDTFTIETRDGSVHRWENAYFVKLPQPVEIEPKATTQEHANSNEASTKA